MRVLRLVALSTVLTVAATTAFAQSDEPQARHRGRAERPKATQGEAPPPRRDKQFPLGSSWSAVSLNGRPFAGERPSFTLDQQFRARGFGGCNTFSATAYPLRDQAIAVGPLALTRKACDKGVMASERAYFVALRSAAKWEATGSSLVLKGPNGELRFERVF